eukprot:2095040-Pyramimonas_sp.AAC.1
MPKPARAFIRAKARRSSATVRKGQPLALSPAPNGSHRTEGRLLRGDAGALPSMILLHFHVHDVHGVNQHRAVSQMQFAPP